MLNKNMLMVGTVLMSVSVMAPAYAGSASDADTMKTDDAMKSDAQELRKDLAAQYEEAENFTYDQKEDFFDWVDAKAEQLGEQYDDVAAEVERDSEDAVDELAEAWDSASDELSEALADAQDASAETWEDVKANTIEALEDAQQAISDRHAAE